MLTVSFIGGRNLHGHMFIKSMSLCFAPLLEKHQIRTSYPVNWTISEYMYKPLHVRTSHVQTSTCTNLYMYKPHNVRTSTCTNLTCTNLYMYEPHMYEPLHVRTSYSYVFLPWGQRSVSQYPTISHIRYNIEYTFPCPHYWWWSLIA